MCCLVLRNHVTIQYYFFSTVINYLGRCLALKSHDSLITCLCKTTWQTKIIISITTVRMAIKFSRRVTYLKGRLSKKSHGSWVTHSCKITWQFKTYLHYHNAYVHQTLQDGSLPWRTPTDNVTWSFEVTCQIKYVISPLALDQWITKTIRWKLTVRVLHP